ncbi:uncharacterized protein LOC127494164 isoform X7 [Ctenopharyngodon idella]|uniref:uncharacterized protein LOC127494164 isoform X7 n=1 Tax=Ctenopharyngodon idella TaxID=7959 RepID=UPI002230DCD0|nr:uncharacterized protein LOC127494164 isoform X7 [Ctenopharyngodon idella]
MKQNCYRYKLRLMKKLGSLLPNIRGDVMKETDLNDLLQDHNESPFSEGDLAEWLKERERESDVIKSVLRQLKDAGAQVEDNIDLLLMELELGNLVSYTFTSLNWSDVLLLQQTTYLSNSTKGETDENGPDSEQKSWLTPEMQKTLRSNLKIFKNLIDSKDREPAKFIVSSKEMKNNPGCCILLYESECDEAVCFIPPSKPACPITEEVKDNSVVLKVPPSCSSTVELRLLYKRKQDRVWTSKPVMKDENTVTLTDLRAGTEYEIKCAALGILNYTVYSDVISVTTESLKTQKPREDLFQSLSMKTKKSDSTDKRRRHCGLENQGSSSCLNAVLQTLFMTKEFRQHVKSVSSDDNFISELKKLFNELETQEKNAVSPAGVTESLGITDVYKQQDAAELLHEILKKTPGSSELFMGKTKTTMTWSSCGHEQERLEDFLSLTISFKHSQDVEDALKAHFDQMCGVYPLRCCHCESTGCKKVSSHKYELYAIVNHSGKYDHSGHYYAGSDRNGYYYADIKCEDGIWRQFIDHRVLKTPSDEHPTLRSLYAYLLVYRRRE